jgi:maltose alpha-D-glucosyltransferase/alpha-amylase
LIRVTRRWEEVFAGRAGEGLEEILPTYLGGRRWFGGKTRTIRSVKITETLPLFVESSTAYITFTQVDYVDGDPETYLLIVACATGEQASHVMRTYPDSFFARIRPDAQDEELFLYDGLSDRDLCSALLEMIARHQRLKGRCGELRGTSTRVFRQIQNRSDAPLEPSILKAEQSNTSVLFKDRFILKLFRRLDRGVNPDLEIGRFLTEKGFPHAPLVAGAIEYFQGRNGPITLGILHGFVPNHGDAWEYTQEVLAHYFESVSTLRGDIATIPVPQQHLLELIKQEDDPFASELVGPYLASARLLGQRSAELHLALASDSDPPAFAPEPFSKLYQRSLYQSMRNMSMQVFQLLKRELKKIPEPLRSSAKRVLTHKNEIIERFRSIVDQKISAVRLRCHGDFHLGQVLYTGKDFVIIDFEGEPANPLSERRLKRSPLRDVAGMLRSFHYAAYAALFAQQSRGVARQEYLPYFDEAARFWHFWVCVAFLKGYVERVDQTSLLPREDEDLRILLDVYLLEKAIYELGYELNNRPEWVRIPLQGIDQLIQF